MLRASTNWLTVVALFLGVWCNAALGIVAYNVPAGTAGNQAFGGSLGLDFNVNQAISVTSVGVFDDGSNGLSLPLQARIYNRVSGLEIPGTFMAFATGPTGTLTGGSRFLNLAAPIILPAGFQGTIVAEGYGAAERNGNQGVSAVAGLTTDTGGGAISFVGGGRNGAFNAFPGGVDGGPANRYAAGTFNFNVLPPLPALGSFTSIPVNNPGFEADVLADGVSIGGAAGWTVGGGGAFNPLATQSTPTEGANVLFSNGGTASQVLSTTLQGGRFYALSVDLIDRLDLTFPSYSVQLFAGGVLLAQDANLQAVPNGGFATATVHFNTLDNAFAAQFGQPLEIRLNASGIQANFDNVRLGFIAVPEPATATLGLLSLGGLLLRRRRTA